MPTTSATGLPRRRQPRAPAGSPAGGRFLPNPVAAAAGPAPGRTKAGRPDASAAVGDVEIGFSRHPDGTWTAHPGVGPAERFAYEMRAADPFYWGFPAEGGGCYVRDAPWTGHLTDMAIWGGDIIAGMLTAGEARPDGAHDAMRGIWDEAARVASASPESLVQRHHINGAASRYVIRSPHCLSALLAEVRSRSFAINRFYGGSSLVDLGTAFREAGISRAVLREAFSAECPSGGYGFHDWLLGAAAPPRDGWERAWPSPFQVDHNGETGGMFVGAGGKVVLSLLKEDMGGGANIARDIRVTAARKDSYETLLWAAMHDDEIRAMVSDPKVGPRGFWPPQQIGAAAGQTASLAQATDADWILHVFNALRTEPVVSSDRWGDAFDVFLAALSHHHAAGTTCDPCDMSSRRLWAWDGSREGHIQRHAALIRADIEALMADKCSPGQRAAWRDLT